MNSHKKHGIQGKHIFLAIALFMLILTVISGYLADQDNKKHESYLSHYQEANRLFESGEYRTAQQYYSELALIYPEAYIIELKQSICALQQENIPEAISHAKQALALNPILAVDDDFMDILIYCYEYEEDEENLARIRSYSETVVEGS